MRQLDAFRATIQIAKFHRMRRDPGNPLGLDHLIEMLEKAETGDFSESKLGRWLGWAQAAVVAANIGATLDDMKDINKKFSEEEPETHIKTVFITSNTTDTEIRSIEIILKVLSELTEEERNRVLDYVTSRAYDI